MPRVGGATTFSKANIIVRPQPGMATFFSYRGLDGKMDEGFTEHSGCRVVDGEKWIATVWMRDGVSHNRSGDSLHPDGTTRLVDDK